MLTRILAWKNNSSKSKIIYSDSPDISEKKNMRDSVYNWDEWASRSGIYHKLPENHKKYLNKVISKLEREVLEKC